MNVMAGVKVMKNGPEAIVELSVERFTNDLRPSAARRLARRLYVAARAAEKINDVKEPLL